MWDRRLCLWRRNWQIDHEGRPCKVQTNRAQYIELVRSIAHILDAIQKNLVGEATETSVSRLGEDLIDSSGALIAMDWYSNENLMIDPGNWRLSGILTRTMWASYELRSQECPRSRRGLDVTLSSSKDFERSSDSGPCSYNCLFSDVSCSSTC